eukprot:gene8676-10188_t
MKLSASQTHPFWRRLEGHVRQPDYLFIENDNCSVSFVVVDNNLGVAYRCVPTLLTFVTARLEQWRREDRVLSDPEEIKRLTRTILMANAENLTALNLRKTLISSGLLTHADEIKMLNFIFTKHPKSGEAWSHRRWVLSNSPAYSAIVLTQEIQVLEDLESMDMWVKRNISDHSGFHHRQLLLKHLYRCVHEGSITLSRVLKLWLGEIKIINSFIIQYPSHETLWSHKRAIFSTYMIDILKPNRINVMSTLSDSLSTSSPSLIGEFKFCSNIIEDRSSSYYDTQSQYAKQYKYWLLCNFILGNKYEMASDPLMELPDSITTELINEMRNVAVSTASSSVALEPADQTIKEVMDWIHKAGELSRSSKMVDEIDSADLNIGQVFSFIVTQVTNLIDLIKSLLHPNPNGGFDLRVTPLIDNLLANLGGQVGDIMGDEEVGNAFQNLFNVMNARLVPKLLAYLNNLISKTFLGNSLHITKVILPEGADEFMVDEDELIADIQDALESEIDTFSAAVDRSRARIGTQEDVETAIRNDATREIRALRRDAIREERRIQRQALNPTTH